MFDGGVDSHLGQGGSGYVVINYNTRAVVAHGFQYSGDFASNNIEEYRGMVAGLQEVGKRRKHGDLITVMGDSQLVVKHMTGKCAVGWKLRYWYDIATRLTDDELVSFHWIRREVNTADEWVKKITPLLDNFNEILDIMSGTIEGACFYVEIFKSRVRR